MTVTPRSGTEVIEMVAHKQIHADVWRCRMCLLERGGYYQTYEEIAEHLTGGPLKGGHTLEGLIRDHDCVFVRVT